MCLSKWIWCQIWKQNLAFCVCTKKPVQCSCCRLDAIFVITCSRWSQFSSSSPSWPASLRCLISPLKRRWVVCLPTCTGSWDLHNKQVISIGGETNSRPGSEPALLPYGEDYWHVGPIGWQWPSPGFEGQMIADRWEPLSPRRKQSGGRGGRGCGGGGVDGRREAPRLLPGRWKYGMMSAWLSVHIHTYLGPKLGWCNVGQGYVLLWGGCKGHEEPLNWITVDGRHQKLPSLKGRHAIRWGHLSELPSGAAATSVACCLLWSLFSSIYLLFFQQRRWLHLDKCLGLVSACLLYLYTSDNPQLQNDLWTWACLHVSFISWRFLDKKYNKNPATLYNVMWIGILKVCFPLKVIFKR